jgi:hypothetical protein
MSVPANPANLSALDRARPWVNRAVWASLVGLLGFGIGASLADTSRSVQLVATALAWIGWTIGLTALAIAHPIGLTALRLLVPATSATGVWVALDSAVPLWQRTTAVFAALLVVATIASAETATWCVDGPSYPNECRYALKTPPSMLPISALSAVATVGSIITGPLLLAARQWIAGSILSALAVGLCWLTLRSLHQLSRRFVVFVPAGFVLHDPLVVLDPVLFRRNVIERLALAEVGTDSLDLTRGAPGTPIEVFLSEKVELTKLSDDLRTGEAGRTARFLASPMRPGAVLREATTRKLPVG